jgi:hypothetical protein
MIDEIRPEDPADFEGVMDDMMLAEQQQKERASDEDSPYYEE